MSGKSNPDKVALDSNVFIYQFEQNPKFVAFITNDIRLKSFKELKILMLSDL